jgi:hypothetical protein
MPLWISFIALIYMIAGLMVSIAGIHITGETWWICSTIYFSIAFLSWGHSILKHLWPRLRIESTLKRVLKVTVNMINFLWGICLFLILGQMEMPKLFIIISIAIYDLFVLTWIIATTRKYPCYISKTEWLKTFKKVNDIQEVCSICLEDMESSRQLVCGHAFHEDCINQWLPKNNTCPYCRRQV